jgi:hypothetical protein
MTRTVLVTGSRFWPRTHESRAYAILLALLRADDHVLHGGTRCETISIDTAADAVADALGCQIRVIRPDYAKFKGREKSAPLARNTDLVQALNEARDAGRETLCIALCHQQSRGTVDCSSKALRAGHRVHEFTTDSLYIPS